MVYAKRDKWLGELSRTWSSKLILLVKIGAVAACIAFFSGIASAQSSCASPANAIVAENCLPGTTANVWDPGLASDDPSIVGFASDISVNVGQTINFKVNTNAGAITMDIYRIGYYGGAGARKVTSVNTTVTLPQTQPACKTDSVRNLVDCGNWANTASWSVPTTAVSGIYFVLLTRTDTQGQNLIVFVVRNDASSSKILFQTNDETWQAYNEWQPSSDASHDPTTAGHSLYGPTGAFDINNRAYAVSYNRPFHTRDFQDESLSWVFGPEYAMIRWLEANGYDITYFSGVDADRSPSLMLNHAVYMTVGHDEYVSGNQRAHIQAARDAGVNMAFFSGNEGFWKTRWENSIDGTNTTYRTLVCYKETYANAVIDPADPTIWTGTWRDPRFSPPGDGGRPENALNGTIFIVNGPGTDNENLAIQVPQADGQMRFWRSTTVAGLAAGQTATMPAGTLGYEWDTDLDNGFRPAGLFDLATASYSLTNDLLLDYGETYGAGTATHHMTMYRAPSGAFVFGAGTVQWSFGLDNGHDDPLNLNTPTDIRMQQATVNLFADMGVQPGTLQSGLVLASASTDGNPPSSIIRTPANGSTVQAGTLVTISGTATDTGGVVAGVEVSVDGGTTWHPATGRGSWTYVWGPADAATVTIKSRAVDDSGNIETPGAGISVTAQGQTDMWGATTTPQIADGGDANAVTVGVKFTSSQAGFISGIRFYKGAANTGSHVGSLWSSTGTLLASATFTGETATGWQQVTFSNAIAITANTTYVAAYFAPVGHYAVTSGYFSTSGITNPPLTFLANSTSPNGVFTYGSSSAFPTTTFDAANYWVDVVYATTITSPNPPAVTTTSPASGTTAISTGTAVSATFNQSMNASTITAGTFTLKVGTTTVAATVSYNTTTLTATLVPSTSLAFATTYTATIVGGTTGVTDLSGRTLATNFNWSFTTAPPPGTCPCSIWNSSVTPGTLDSGDATAVELGVKFTASQSGFVTGIRFFKGAANTGTHVGNLWNTGGTNLGSAIFTSESATGWQQVNFTNPIPVTANTTYIASYFAPVGHYSVDSQYFATTGVTNLPLQALANTSSPNGVFGYGTTSNFPNSDFNATNYWVDVVFGTTATATAPSVTSVSPTSGATAISTATSVSAVFNESMNAATISTSTFTLKAGTSTVAATVTYNAASLTATLVPSAALAYSTTYTASIVGGASGVKDLNGIAMSATFGSTFTTAPPPGGCPCSIWTSGTTPGTIDSGDKSPVTLGLKFTSSQAGFITGIRFYKGTANTGTHIGSLWSSTGTLLTSATFTAETASGWQQVNFSNAVGITAGTTYVASYYAPVGRYSDNANYFSTAGVSNAPLQALANTTSPNGVYNYGSANSFPTSTFAATNYWVDVVFSTTATASAPTVTSVSPASGTTAVSTGTTAKVTFNESMNAATLTPTTLKLTTGTTTVPATVSYDSTSLTATITPTAALAYSTTYTGTVVSGASGVKDQNGSAMAANFTWTFTTAPPPGTCPCSIWNSSTTPGNIDSGDTNGVTLGVKFISSQSGFISGIRFYKGTANTGTHIGRLWSSTGALLATATFTGETASGWQQVNFSTPVAVTAGTTYVASYYAPVGRYSYDAQFFTAGISNPPLQALSNGASANGVYAYGSATVFPTATFGATNYWVDVVFKTTLP